MPQNSPFVTFRRTSRPNSASKNETPNKNVQATPTPGNRGTPVHNPPSGVEKAGVARSPFFKAASSTPLTPRTPIAVTKRLIHQIYQNGSPARTPIGSGTQPSYSRTPNSPSISRIPVFNSPQQSPSRCQCFFLCL